MVEFNSNFVFEEAMNHLDAQTEYGHGLKGEKPTTQQLAWDAGEFSWGAKLDGSSVIQFDGLSRPYSVSGNNFDKFYKTGSTFTNTLSLSGGTSNSLIRNNTVIALPIYRESDEVSCEKTSFNLDSSSSRAKMNFSEDDQGDYLHAFLWFPF